MHETSVDLVVLGPNPKISHYLNADILKYEKQALLFQIRDARLIHDLTEEKIIQRSPCWPSKMCHSIEMQWSQNSTK